MEGEKSQSKICKTCDAKYFKKTTCSKEEWGRTKYCSRKCSYKNPEKNKILKEKRGGENSNFWRGGVSSIHKIIRSSKEYKLWRQAVFERDAYKCTWCGDAKGGNLQADHIKPFALFPELRFAIDNGRTLCERCHQKTDSYGWKLYHTLLKKYQTNHDVA